MGRHALVIIALLTGSCAHRSPASEEPADAPETPPAPAVEEVKAAAPAVKLPPAPPLLSAPPFLGDIEAPPESPTTPEKVQLGHMLFFDKRLSKDGSMACEGCHHIADAYTEGQSVSAKVGGAMNKRNAPTMLNIGYHRSFYWDGRMPTLEKVIAAAWAGQLGAAPAEIAAKLNENATYRAHFQRAFQSDATGDNIPMALAAFLRELKSGNTPFDKFEQGEKNAVSPEAVRGFEVFKKAGCALCHVPPLYSDFDFHNVGVGWNNLERDQGRMDHTKDDADEGKFKTPPLRDIAKTGPYFHDGSVKTLDEAIDLMVGGGIKNPKLDVKLKPAKLSKKDRAALKAFLESLSGEYTYDTPPELPE